MSWRRVKRFRFSKRCKHYSDPKVRYRTEDQAEAAARVMADLHPGEVFESFRCEHCRHWHAGRDHEEEFG